MQTLQTAAFIFRAYVLMLMPTRLHSILLSVKKRGEERARSALGKIYSHVIQRLSTRATKRV